MVNTGKINNINPALHKKNNFLVGNLVLNRVSSLTRIFFNENAKFAIRNFWGKRANQNI